MLPTLLHHIFSPALCFGSFFIFYKLSVFVFADFIDFDSIKLYLNILMSLWPQTFLFLHHQYKIIHIIVVSNSRPHIYRSFGILLLAYPLILGLMRVLNFCIMCWYPVSALIISVYNFNIKMCLWNLWIHLSWNCSKHINISRFYYYSRVNMHTVYCFYKWF